MKYDIALILIRYISQTRKIPEPLTTVKTNSEPMVPVLVHTTLIRDQNGLGFSISGGEGTSKNNSDVNIFSL